MSKVDLPPTADTFARSGAAAPRSAAIDANRLTRRGRVRKWDRSPPPHDWRWYVGNLGKILIAVGLLIFGFVAYQLYGTGIQTAAAQNQLENEFEDMLAGSELVGEPAASADAPVDSAIVDPAPDQPIEPIDPADTADTAGPAVEDAADPADTERDVQATAPVVAAEDQNLAQVENGDAVARLEIPAIGVDDIVVAGVETSDLRKGPGHFPDTPLPGQLGNSAIAGHRTTYGQPFRNVDRLEVGDEIRVTTLNGVYLYRVTGQQIVPPSASEVVATTDPTMANLTLTSCHPVFTARERIVIFSELDTGESGPVGEPVLNYGRPPRTADAGAGEPTVSPPSESVEATEAVTGVDQLGTDAVNEGIADAFSESWFSDPAANPQVGLWGFAVSAIAIAAYLISRRFRRDWAGLVVGIVPFTIALYFFFQNVNRLLPPNL